MSRDDFDVDFVMERFTYPNPKFYENQRLGFSNFTTPQTISLLEDTGNDYLTLPRGLVKELFLYNPSIELLDKTFSNPIKLNPSKIILKDYQREPVNQMLKRNQGIIIAPPGSGKTVMGIETMVKRSQKSLILVHTKDLANQWIERINNFTDVTPGIVDSDHFSVKDITVGMVQSLNKPLEQSFLKQFGLVMLDEAHHAPAFTFQKLINQFPARYRYGLTATPERGDGLTFILKAVIGPVLHEIKGGQLFISGNILKPKIKVVHTSFYLPDCRDYNHLLNRIVRNDKRNSLIVNQIRKEASKGHYCLVLSERIAHIRTLFEIFSTLCPEITTACLTSKNTKSKRTQAIEAMNQGKINVLFATKLADEGLDIRRLNRLFLTCPVRSVNKVRQQMGRILRTFPGKIDAIVYDFVDSLCSLAQSQYITRKKCAYAEYEIKEFEYGGNPNHEKTV
jgi:superfamily II DNA or RNA helicase